MKAAAKKQSKASSGEFAAFVSDASVTDSMIPVLAERGWALDCVTTGGIEMAIRLLGTMPSPAILLVDLSESEDPRADINALAEVCEPGTAVITIGKINDVRFYRELLDAGILDYLVKPFSPDDFRAAIITAEHAQRLPEEAAASGEATANRAVTVLGTRGGVGASLIAATSAWIMANQLGRTVALLDLDIHFGTDALVFDLEPGRGLVDALDNPSRVDSLFVERAVIKESENLSVLSAEASLNDAPHPDPAALHHLLTELRNTYQVTVVDVPRHVAAQYPLVLAEATDILLVTDMTLAATRDTIRLLSFIKESAPHAQVRIVANRISAGGVMEVDQKDFEASIERKVDLILPNDSKNIVMATKRAKPLAQAAPSSKLVQSLRNMSEEIAGGRDKAEESSFWQRLLGKVKK